VQKILAKQRQLDAFKSFATDDSAKIRSVLAEIASLRAQLAEAQSQRQQQGSLGQVITKTNRADRIRKEFNFAYDLYYSDKRFYEGMIVTDMTANANMRILEPAFLDPARQFNIIPLELAVMLELVGLAVEFYRLHPPVGDHAIGAAMAR